jgi:hypothetical protein
MRNFVAEWIGGRDMRADEARNARSELKRRPEYLAPAGREAVRSVPVSGRSGRIDAAFGTTAVLRSAEEGAATRFGLAQEEAAVYKLIDRVITEH